MPSMATIPRQMLIHHPPHSPIPAFGFALAATITPRAITTAYALPTWLAHHPRSAAGTGRHPALWGPRWDARRALSSKRPLVTSAAASKHDTAEPLDHVTPPPPPRNAGAAAVPGLNDLRPLRKEPERLKKENDITSKAIDSDAAAVTRASASWVEPSPRPKTKLRPLRAAVKLTPAAVEHIKSLLDLPEPKLLRIGTRRRGCSGLAYHLEYVDKADKFDEVVKQDGVEVLVEGRALLTVLGSTMDWVDEKLGSRFVFHNPNIKEQCGCGESFMV